MPETVNDVTYSTFAINVEAAATRRETMAGQEYLVGPAVIAKEGVMNRVKYSAYELQRSLRTWNGRPVILRHSYNAEGKPISANAPDVINQQGLGYMFNTTWGADNKLRTEVWLRMSDIADGKIPGIEKDGTIANGVLELSTGIFHNYYQWAGEFDGEPYDIEAYDCIGDHLALLPGETGAYSVKAGAGFPRWNVAMNSSEHSAILAHVKEQKAELVTVSGNFFVYSKGGKLYKHTHCVKEGVCVPSSEQETEVAQVTEFVSINQKTKETPKMPETPKEKTISDFTKEEIVAAFNAAVKPEELPAILAAKAPWLSDAKSVYDEHRSGMIEVISANANNTFTKEELSAMPHGTLTKLHKLATVTVAKVEEQPAARFDASGAVISDNSSKKVGATAVSETPLAEPTLTFQR